ncbi:MAG TPA: hypothetical protein VNH22_19405 [Blastocatellia bacterium]|nr:hypothetical protein [Blastocatellia bacterium]
MMVPRGAGGGQALTVPVEQFDVAAGGGRGERRVPPVRFTLPGRYTLLKAANRGVREREAGQEAYAVFRRQFDFGERSKSAEAARKAKACQHAEEDRRA